MLLSLDNDLSCFSLALNELSVFQSMPEGGMTALSFLLIITILPGLLARSGLTWFNYFDQRLAFLYQVRFVLLILTKQSSGSNHCIDITYNSLFLGDRWTNLTLLNLVKCFILKFFLQNNFC